MDLPGGGDAASSGATGGATDDGSSVVESSEDEFDDILHTPKKRKLTTTSKYIYENLFMLGKDSDVNVTITSPDFQEKSWKLHKLYLGQSLYFQVLKIRGKKGKQPLRYFVCNKMSDIPAEGKVLA